MSDERATDDVVVAVEALSRIQDRAEADLSDGGSSGRSDTNDFRDE